MVRRLVLVSLCLLAQAVVVAPAAREEIPFERDVIATSRGDLEIFFIGHASLMMRFDEHVIYVDPLGRLANLGALPKADLVLITHDHGDHLDLAALGQLRQEETQVIVSAGCEGRVENAVVLRNGEHRVALGLGIEAIPAYNLVHLRGDGEPYHLKGEGNGYVLEFGTTRVYIAGDTENVPEVKALRDIAVAFLPMNLPYTMTPEEVADAARAIRPRILYPYHYGDTDPMRLVELLKDRKDIEVRIRPMR
jgi:L-ascorbate metabolism protein UlaG (beta-lactamase superfamily)